MGLADTLLTPEERAQFNPTLKQKARDEKLESTPEDKELVPVHRKSNLPAIGNSLLTPEEKAKARPEPVVAPKHVYERTVGGADDFADMMDYEHTDMKELGKNMLGLGETALSMGMSAVLWPMSKIAGLAVLYKGKDKAVNVENTVMDWAYRPRTAMGQKGMEGIGRGMGVILAPAKWIGHAVETGPEIFVEDPFMEYTPSSLGRAGWLAETLAEAWTFKALSRVPGALRAKGELGKVSEANAPKTRAVEVGERHLDPDSGVRRTQFQIQNEQGQRVADISLSMKGDTGFINLIESDGVDPMQWRRFLRNDLKEAFPELKKVQGVREGRLVQFKLKELLSPEEEIAAHMERAQRNGLTVRDLMMNRSGNMKSHFLDSEIFIQSIEKNLDVPELESVPFIIEKTRPEVLDALVEKGVLSEDVAAHAKAPSTKLLNEVSKISQYLDDGHKFLQENWTNVGWHENYVTHLWDTGWLKKTKTARAGAFTKRNPFMKERRIPSYAEGMEAGYTPRTTNIAEILRVYDAYKIKSAFNAKFAEALKEVKSPDGMPVVMRADKAPTGYIELNHPALNRAMYVGKAGKATKMPLLVKTPVAVHPEAYKLLRNIFDRPYDGKVASALTQMNAFTKKAILSISFFHHLALTEAAFANGIGLKALGLLNPFEMYRQMKKGDWMAVRKTPLFKQGLHDGITIDPLPDYHVNTVHKALRDIEFRTRKVPGLRKLTKGIRRTNEIWDTALWNYMHTNLKMMAYEKLVGEGMARLEKSGRPISLEAIKTMREQKAQFVNDSFGGQNWEMSEMMGSPKMQQAMSWILLSPDWTISTLQQSMAPFRYKKPHLQKSGIKFALRAAFYYNLIAQSLNYHNTKKAYGTGRFTIDNPPGHELDIFMGHEDYDANGNPIGPERYIKIGKQFREPIEWAMKPARKFGSKLAPPLRETIRQLSGHDPGSFYPTKFADADSTAESVKERLKSIALVPIPLSIRPYLERRSHPFMLSIPTSKGMTKYSGTKQMERAMRKQDHKKLKRLFIHALQNNLNAEQMVQNASNKLVSSIRYDNKLLAKDILLEMQQIPDPVAREDLIQHYRDKGIFTEAVQAEYVKLIEELDSIRQQQEAYGVSLSAKP